MKMLSMTIVVVSMLCAPIASAVFPSESAYAEDEALAAQTTQAIEDVFAALTSGDPAEVEPYLAPEFQIVRTDGGAYDKQTYLERSIPKISSEPIIRDLVVTRNGDIVVSRFWLGIEEVIDGKKAVNGALQLIVFRIMPDIWQVVATANMAPLED